jgi:hypothetical protein
MARKKNVVSNEGGPLLTEVGKRNGEVNFGRAKIALNLHLEAPLR